MDVNIYNTIYLAQFVEWGNVFINKCIYKQKLSKKY